MPAALSASGIRRAAACAPAYALPAVEEPSRDSARGRAIHAYMEGLACGLDVDELLAEVPADLRDWCSKIDRRQIPPRGEPEVTLAYDVRTGRARRLEAAAGFRDYSGCAPTEIGGTVDLLVLTADTPRIVDWKSTAWAHDVEASRPQLEVYALAAARLVGAPAASWSCAILTDDGAVAWQHGALDEDGLAEVAARVARAWEGVQRERAERARLGAAYLPDVALGDHCRHCPAIRHCPAHRAVAAGEGTPEEVTPENLGAAYAAAIAAEKRAEQIRASARALVERLGPVPLGDGRAVKLDTRGHLKVVRAA